MDTIGVIVAIVSTIAFTYQAWVSWRILRFPQYSGTQRASQLCLVWLIPFFGALAAQLVMYGLTTKPRSRDKDFIPEDNAMS